MNQTYCRPRATLELTDREGAMNTAVFSVSTILVLAGKITPRFSEEFYKSRSNTAHLVVVNSTEIAFRQTITDKEKTLKQRRGYTGEEQSRGFVRKRRS